MFLSISWHLTRRAVFDQTFVKSLVNSLVKSLRVRNALRVGLATVIFIADASQSRYRVRITGRGANLWNSDTTPDMVG